MSKGTDRDSKFAQDLYWGIARIGIDLEEMNEAGLVLIAIKLYPARAGGVDWTCVVSAFVEGVRSVAFVSSPRPEDVLRVVAAGLANGSLKWREDKYAN